MGGQIILFLAIASPFTYLRSVDLYIKGKIDEAEKGSQNSR